MQAAGRRRPALDAQSALGAADDAWQHGQERLEIVTGQRLNIHLRGGHQIARRHWLHALGGRVRRRHDVHALADERQSHLDQDVFGRPALNGERRRLGVGKALPGGPHDVAAGRHIGKVTCPTPSLVVRPITMLPEVSNNSTVTAGMRKASREMVTTTRPPVAPCVCPFEG